MSLEARYPKVLDETSDEERKLAQEIRALKDKQSDISLKRSEKIRGWTIRLEKQIAESFKLREDHVKLLRRMDFRAIYGSETACLGVSGYYPFGNYEWVDDIYLILGWEREYDENGLTEKCQLRAYKMMLELPHAVNYIIRQFQFTEGEPVTDGNGGTDIDATRPGDPTGPGSGSPRSENH